MRCAVVAVLAFLGLSGASAQTGGVAVIAPSVSTSMEARRILLESATAETSLRHAVGVLVVVRSPLSLPLRRNYDSYCELREDADRQLNIAGPKFHVYIYRLHDDMSVIQVSHRSYKAD